MGNRLMKAADHPALRLKISTEGYSSMGAPRSNPSENS